MWSHTPWSKDFSIERKERRVIDINSEIKTLEAMFVQAVLNLAKKYGVVANIDFDRKTVNFEGEFKDGTDEADLARELSEMFDYFAD